MYRLLFQGRLADRAPLLVRDPLLWIGRDPSCALRLTDDGVTERHAAIERREDGYYLSAALTSTGARVNGQPATQHRLSSGDEIEIGSVRLQFEILHGVTATRRVVDAIQLTACAIIALVIAGQVAVFIWIFSSPRPAHLMKRPPSIPASPPAPIAVVNPPATTLPPPAPVAPVTPTPAAPSRPVVLTRMIRIDRVQRSVDAGRVTLTLQLKAQVGERSLDASAVGVCVQFFVRQPDQSVRPWPLPLWLKIPEWSNFSTKQLAARFPGQAAEYAGYVVRSYYRGQLQDVGAEPQSLLAQAPDPMAK